MEKTGNMAAGREGFSAGNAGIGTSEQPNGVLECWSVGEMVKLSHPQPHHHLRRGFGEGGSITPALWSGK